MKTYWWSLEKRRKTQVLTKKLFVLIHSLLQFPRNSLLWKLQFPARETVIPSAGNCNSLGRETEKV